MRNQNKELYEEAVGRNLSNAEKKPEKYIGKELEKAKMMLGVRKIDDYWDNRILKLCKDSAIK